VIGLLTSRDLPFSIKDEDHLIQAFAGLSIKAEPVIWEDPQDWAQFEAIIVRTPWDYFQKINQFWQSLEHIAAKTLLLNPLPLMQWNRDKHYLLELQQQGVEILPSFEIRNLKHLLETMQTLEADRFVLKPFVSAGAYKTYAFEAGKIPAEIEQINFSQESFMLQPFLKEIQTQGEASLMYFNNEFSHAILKLPALGDFRVQEDFGGVVKKYIPGTAELSLAEKVLSLIPFKALYARVDISWWRERPCLMEVELIEPELFFRMNPESALKLVKAYQSFKGSA
jgi:hypothetical protein